MAATTGIPYQFPPGTVNQPVIIIQQHQTSQPALQNYPRNCSLGLGIAQIICGVVSIVLGFVLLSFNSYLGAVSYGVWGAVCPILAGSFGIASAISKSKFSIVTVLVLSIITAVLNIAPFVLAILDGLLMYYYLEVALLNSLLCIVLFAEFVLAIVASRLACRVVSCKCCGEPGCCCCRGEEGKIYPTVQTATYLNICQGQTHVVQGHTVTPVDLDIIRAMQNQSMAAQSLCSAESAQELTLIPPRYQDEKLEFSTPPPSYNVSPFEAMD